MTTNAVHSATNAAADGLRGPVDPWRIVTVWEWFLGIFILAVVLGLTGLALYLWWRARKRRLHPETLPPPPVPAHVRARRDLEDALRHLSNPDLFCTEVSRILRQYLEERFGWNAPDRTTEEFLIELRHHEELQESQRGLLAEFLTGCDRVKFARHDPSEPELRELHNAAVRLVEDTVPIAAPPAVEGRPVTSLTTT